MLIGIGECDVHTVGWLLRVVCVRAEPCERWFMVQRGMVDVISAQHEYVYVRLLEGETFGEVGVFVCE